MAATARKRSKKNPSTTTDPAPAKVDPAQERGEIRPVSRDQLRESGLLLRRGRPNTAPYRKIFESLRDVKRGDGISVEVPPDSDARVFRRNTSQSIRQMMTRETRQTPGAWDRSEWSVFLGSDKQTVFVVRVEE